MPIDREKTQALLDRIVGELGAALTVPLVVIGDRLGLYRALAEHGPLDAAALARHTGTHTRYIREWLSAQSAAGFVQYNAGQDDFSLAPEQAAIFADEKSPVSMLGGFELAAGAIRGYENILDAFRTGAGVGWGEQHPDVCSGTGRFFRPAYANHLVRHWIPALEGVQEKLQRGARAADVGCGLGHSTLLMARAFPASEFLGIDLHPASVENARAAAAKAGLSERCRFEVASAHDLPGRDYDLITFFDCLHDMGDPIGAAAKMRACLAPDGCWMVVEPLAGAGLAENQTPVGRMFYAASTLVCTPASLSEDVGLGLGAQAGEARLREVILAGGFAHVRRAAETKFNLVLEARA
ncbi:MAG: class I SAM-dependent methyltransferase [Deltaproteobacteria bacterium]